MPATPARRTRHLLRICPTVLLLAAAMTLGVPASLSSASVDPGLSPIVRTALDEVRRNAGVEPLFERRAYRADAAAIAQAVLDGSPRPLARESSPSLSLRLVVADDQVERAVTDNARGLARAFGRTLTTPLTTDGGWAVAVRRQGDGSSQVAIAAVIGWPDPAVPANAACTGWGYCWHNRGLHPHLPWTCNTVRWQLSTSNLPPAAESVVVDAIARLEAAGGLGVDLVYAGRTAATTLQGVTRFLVRFASSCDRSDALACSVPLEHGPTRLVGGALVSVVPGQWARRADRELWVGTVAHEIAHAIGLDHYDGYVNGRRQLMASTLGPNTLGLGDVNGLRTLARPGRLSARMRIATTYVRPGETARATVHASNAGLGGLRSVRVDCTDEYGVWRQVAYVSGVWDGRGRDIGLAWPGPGGLRREARCRAVVRGTGSVVVSAEQPITVGW